MSPFQAALASAVSFSAGALAPSRIIVPAIALATLVRLGALGGAPMSKPALRVTVFGALALAITAGVGALIVKAI